MSAACQKCGGTGEMVACGIYDCSEPGCTAAVDRTALEAAVKAAGPMLLEDAIWFAYQQGQQNKPWVKLWDSQWVNIVNHDHCYESMDKEEAVHLAVKMTEERCRLNNTEKK